MKAYPVLHRVFVVGLLLAVVLLVSWLLWQPERSLVVQMNGQESRAEPQEPHAELSMARSEEVRGSLASPEVLSLDSEDAVASREPVTQAGTQVKSLVAELERLAREPLTFHRLALPVMSQLAEACVDEESPLDGLLGVIHATERNELVRGAVLVAIARRLPPHEFDSAVLHWFGSDETPLEILRAAAIAAARRGEDSRCGLPLDLEYLGELQTRGDLDDFRMPRIFPLRLTSSVSQSHADLLRVWLTGAEAQAGRLQSAPSEMGMSGVAELLVTAETLYAVWGHASLEDAVIEASVARDAFRPEELRGDRPSIFLRAANFLVHSLAACSDRFFDLAATLAASEDGALRSFASSMEGHLSSGLGVALIAKIERVRYSLEGVDYVELCEYLMEVGDGLASIGDPRELERAVAYLDDIVQDEMVHEAARSTALMALEEKAPWDALVASVSKVIQPRVSFGLYAIAVTSLVKEAGSDVTRRQEANRLLVNARDRVTDERIRSSLVTYIEQLSL